MSHVSQIGLSWSERHSARGSYTAAVDLRSLQLHHEIATLLVGAQSLMPLVVEYMAKYSQSLFKKADNYITVINALSTVGKCRSAKPLDDFPAISAAEHCQGFSCVKDP